MSSHLTVRPVNASSTRLGTRFMPPPRRRRRRRLQGFRPIRTPRAVPGRGPRTTAPQKRRRILRCYVCFASTGLGILVQQQRVVQRSVVVLCPSEMSRRTPYRVPTGLRREIDGVPGVVVEVRGATVRVCVYRCVFRRRGKSEGLLIRWMDGWPCISVRLQRHRTVNSDNTREGGVIQFGHAASIQPNPPVISRQTQQHTHTHTNTHETALPTKLPFSISPISRFPSHMPDRDGSFYIVHRHRR